MRERFAGSGVVCDASRAHEFDELVCSVGSAADVEEQRPYLLREPTPVADGARPRFLDGRAETLAGGVKPMTSAFDEQRDVPRSLYLEYVCGLARLRNRQLVHEEPSELRGSLAQVSPDGHQPVLVRGTR